MKRLIGIWGYPEPKALKDAIKQYPDNELVDLDINTDAPSSGVLPEAYCRIMRNIVDNATALRNRLDIIIASVGREKCDSGWFAAQILKDQGFNVIETQYEQYTGTNLTPISKSNLPLREKITAIMDGTLRSAQDNVVETSPEFGFWGVPPNDLSFLEIFPDNTHVYGWTRCVEAGRPADIELEMYIDEGVPTVFFAQTFCAKMALAKYLAQKHNGLYVDVDDMASNSVRAKIEAFIKLG